MQRGACHCEEGQSPDVAIRTPALSVSSAASSPTGGAKTGPENPTEPCLPPRGRCPRRGRRGPASPVLSLRGAPNGPTRQSVPHPLSQLRCQLPHRGSQDQARGPQRPLPPPLGEVPPQGAERARIPRPVIARSAATRQSVPRPKPSPGGRWHGAAVTDEGDATDNRALPTKQL